MNKLLHFIQEIGTIMYVGGILSHIVIGAVLGHPDATTAYHVSVYKMMSAYILILPGLGLKILSDAVLWFHFKVKPNWFKAKLAMTAFLAVNAFVILAPMMPELVVLAKESMKQGTAINQAFLDKAETEKLVGMTNIIPLVLELIFGSFKPRLFDKPSQS